MITLALLLLAAEDFRALDPREHPAPHTMLSAYLQQIAQQQLAARRAEVERITSKEIYDQRKKQVRETVLRLIGGLDTLRTPLNVRKTGTLLREGYRVEKIAYESRPQFYVTASLYVPNGKGPFPAVLQPVGHSTSAKNRLFYQRIALALVHQGFVVLTYDPLGQGERRVFWDRDLGDSKVGGGTAEHNMIGWQSLLAGESIARYMIWDGLRGIDLLASRPDVDAQRIGVTGCSGGGTLTTYIAALDDRVKAAAPACYISSWEDQLQGTGPQDAEQQFPGMLLAGLDHADWIGLAAPKPYLILSTDEDFFPLAGARKSFAEMKRIYTLYDAAVKVDWFHEPGGHGVPPASRHAIAGWMTRWLKGEASPKPEPPLVTEHEEDLNVTPTGQVATSWGGATASTENMRRFAAVRPQRLDLRKDVVRLTRFEQARTPLQLKRGRVVNGVEPITFESQPGLTIPAALARPANPDRSRTVLFLDPLGKRHALASDGDAAQLVRDGYTVFAVDLSGVGEVAFARHAQAPWNWPQVSWLALMVGRPLMGLRMNDVVRALDALDELRLLPAGGVVAYARGRLAPLLLHAAVVDQRIAAVVAEDCLVSYRAVATSPLHKDLEESVVPGVLAHYDLPDLAAALRVRMVNVRSPTGGLAPLREAEKSYTDKVLRRREEEPLSTLVPRDWLR